MKTTHSVRFSNASDDDALARDTILIFFHSQRLLYVRLEVCP